MFKFFLLFELVGNLLILTLYNIPIDKNGPYIIL